MRPLGIARTVPRARTRIEGRRRYLPARAMRDKAPLPPRAPKAASRRAETAAVVAVIRFKSSWLSASFPMPGPRDSTPMGPPIRLSCEGGGTLALSGKASMAAVRALAVSEVFAQRRMVAGGEAAA